MTPTQQAYMEKWGTFYKDLYYGRKKPRTPEQRDFIRHIKMRLGTNEHERAFLAWLNPPKEKMQKKKPLRSHTVIKRRPRKARKDDAIAWMKWKPVPPPPLPEPNGKKEKSSKPNYDDLSSGKAHGDKGFAKGSLGDHGMSQEFKENLKDTHFMEYGALPELGDRSPRQA